MLYTDDPIRDFEMHDAEQTRRLERLPVCVECGEHIQSEEYYMINDEPMCRECLDLNHKAYVEDYIE